MLYTIIGGVMAVALVFWGYFRAFARVNQNLEDIKALLRARDSK
jgi:hypothetical protein